MITLSCRINGGDFDAAGLATRKLKDHLARLGVDGAALRRAMIAAYEAEMNVVIHARTGTLWARVDETRLDLEVTDEGPGIPDVELAMKEGWSTASEQARQMGFGAGLGLPNIRHNSDRFQIETRVGRGTRVRSTILFGNAPAVPTERAEPEQAGFALLVEQKRCRGCRRCIFACPVGALRVRDCRPVVSEQLCIGCAACIEECPDNMFGIRDTGVGLAKLSEGALLLASRGLFSAFPGEQSPSRALAAAHDLGFTDVRLLEDWDDPLRAEARREVDQGNLPLPRIPPLCPPVVSLIESRFPSLIRNISPMLSPAETACEEFPLRSVVLVAACPGQYEQCARSSLTDRLRVASATTLKTAMFPRFKAKSVGLEPATVITGNAGPGEGELSASGARGVIRALSLAETGALGGVALLELHLCLGGCSASPLLASLPGAVGPAWTVERNGEPAGVAARARPFQQRSGMRLDPDMTEAMRKLSLIDSETKSLPGRDCGSCGSPSCALFAEDVVMGRAARSDCPFLEKKT